MVESWDVCKSKGREKKKKKKGDEGDAPKAGCWVRLRFIGSYISSRSKVDTWVSGTGTNTHYGKFITILLLFHVFIYLFLYTSIGFLKYTLNIFLVIKGSYAWNNVKVENINALFGWVTSKEFSENLTRVTSFDWICEWASKAYK